MGSFAAGAGGAVAFLALVAGAVADDRESGDFDRERVCITSKHGQSKTSRKSSQKFDSCSLHSLGQLPMRADESESVGFRIRNLKVPRKQLRFTECNTGLQNTTGSYFSSPNATLGCKTRQARRGQGRKQPPTPTTRGFGPHCRGPKGRGSRY